MLDYASATIFKLLSSSGSSLAAMPVEPTRSQNRTVRCRRSAPECDATVAAAVTFVCGAEPCWQATIALSSRLRSPSGIPIISRSASVRSNSTSTSTAFRREDGDVLREPELLEPLPDVHRGSRAIAPVRGFSSRLVVLAVPSSMAAKHAGGTRATKADRMRRRWRPNSYGLDSTILISSKTSRRRC
jgi:hypothetical protein